MWRSVARARIADHARDVQRARQARGKPDWERMAQIMPETFGTTRQTVMSFTMTSCRASDLYGS